MKEGLTPHLQTTAAERVHACGRAPAAHAVLADEGQRRYDSVRACFLSPIG
jgi:hypothetical protein